MFMLTEEIDSVDWKARMYPTYKSWLTVFYWVNCVIAVLYILVYNIFFQIIGGSIFIDYSSGNVAMARGGILTHVAGGIIFLVTGYLQFNKRVRQKYPDFHRTVGYVYMFMIGVMCLGIFVVLGSYGSLGKSVSLFWIVGVYPYWIYVHVDGLVSIWRKDIARHRRMMFRGFCFGNGIIWMRLPFFTLLLVNFSTVQVSLADAFWIVSLMAIGVSELYVVAEKFFLPPPVVYLKDQKSFFMATTGMPGQAMAPVGIEVDECEMLPDQTSMKFTFRVKNHHQVPVFFPGQHVALHHADIPGSAREYSPVVMEEHHLKGQVSLWVRLVKGGVMSGELKKYCESYTQLKAASGGGGGGGGGGGEADHTGGEVQHNPMARGASSGGGGGGDDYAHKATEEGTATRALRCPFLFSVSSSRLAYFPNSYRYLIMAATGTGLAPLIPLIQSVLNNPNDETGLYLIYACAAENDYGRKLLDDVIAASGSGKQQLTVEYKVRGTDDSRVNLASIENAVEGLARAGKLVSRETSKKFQVHLSGSPAFVKGLHLHVAASKKLAISRQSRSLQLIAWGYTDR